MNNLKIDFDNLVWESAATGVRCKNFQQNGKKLRLLEFSNGFVESDWCVKGHIGYVLEGEMKIDFNGMMLHYKQGDGIFIPNGEETKHKAIVNNFVSLVLVEDT